MLGAGLLPQLGPPDLGGGLALEPELRGALAASRRVGGLLLKAEEREAAAIAVAAQKLLGSTAAAPARPMPCGAERAATVECYGRNGTVGGALA